MRKIDIEEMEFVAGGYGENEMQEVIITGQRMSTWDKLVSYVGDFVSGGFVTVGGIVPVAGPVGVGASVTVTTDHSVLVTGLVGSAGPIATVGITPAGTTPTDYLLNGGVGANGKYGVGGSMPVPGTLSDATVTIGTPGVAVGYTVQPTAIAASAASAATNIVNQATYWGNQQMGIPQ